MNEPNVKKSAPEPDSATREKDSIRKSQEEFIGDEAEPSKDISEVGRQARPDGEASAKK
ncbi:MAG: hypothetical protein JO117_10950 [Verrucomicrobia bacterium]|nr:hypothetical protein [Verrucomicrobiota bacterium]